MKCYLCGSRQNLTEDHVPAKTFFPKPRPDDLIKVPCCKSCHEPLTKDDEAFRTWVICAQTNSPSVKKLFDQGVLQKTIDRSAKLHEHILRHIVSSPVFGVKGIELLPALNFPQDRAERFLVRVTKAMIAKFYPSYDYSSDSFGVRHLWSLTDDQVACVMEMQTKFHKDSRGDKVFQFWRAVGDVGGAWIFIFYEAVGFVVFHRHTKAANSELSVNHQPSPH